MLDGLKMVAVFAGGVLVAAGPFYAAGHIAGKRDGTIPTLERSITVLRERGEIDAEMSSSTAGSLCAHYRLSDADARECVRRLESPGNDAGNGAVHHDQGPAVR
jgi:hypothetical protein